jgi:hypothetical protein
VRDVLKKNDIKLYNLLFPGYLLWLMPLTPIWLIAIPGNFIIDSAIILITIKYFRISMPIYKRSIIKTWLLGFLADIIGSTLLFVISNVCYSIYESTGIQSLNNFRLAIEYNPFESIPALTVTILAIVFSGFCIYFFNLKISFKNVDIDEKLKRRFAIIIAIATSPYMFLVPGEWFF